ncbi:hypothetical protein O206_12855 [Ochrobactrum sp. EGD-AQ16]|nr:hypothetical protein O206_12855 [Ochrobactrum sp. EGD-AQ16]
MEFGQQRRSVYRKRKRLSIYLFYRIYATQPRFGKYSLAKHVPGQASPDWHNVIHWNES